MRTLLILCGLMLCEAQAAPIQTSLAPAEPSELRAWQAKGYLIREQGVAVTFVSPNWLGVGEWLCCGTLTVVWVENNGRVGYGFYRRCGDDLIGVWSYIDTGYLSGDRITLLP